MKSSTCPGLGLPYKSDGSVCQAFFFFFWGGGGTPSQKLYG